MAKVQNLAEGNEVQVEIKEVDLLEVAVPVEDRPGQEDDDDDNLCQIPVIIPIARGIWR